VRPYLVLALALAPACSFEPPENVGDDAPVIDADPGAPDADPTRPDAAPDAPSAPAKAFDVAYVDRWRLTGVVGQVPFEALGVNLFVNTGTEPLDLTTLSIVSYSDDNSQAGFSAGIYAEIENNALQPGEASGELVARSRELIVDGGLVTEPRVDTMKSYLELHGGNMPQGDYLINATIKVRIEEQELDLPVVLEHRDGNYAIEQLTAQRVSTVLD